MPVWPFRRKPSAAAAKLPAAPPSKLDAIDETRPHRFRFWLERAADQERALAALEKLIARGDLTIEPVSEADGRLGFEASSTFDPRTAAILQPLYALDRASVRVRGLEMLDLVTDVDEDAVARAVAAWDKFKNTGPHRRRLEVLAGSEILEMCLKRARASQSGGPGAVPPGQAAWRFAVSSAAFNTPGSERQLLVAAREARGRNEATGFVDNAADRATLTTLIGERFDPPEDAMVALIRRGSYVAERAASLAQSMRAPLPEPIAEALCAAVGSAGNVAIHALAALNKAAPTAAVRKAVDAALATTEPNLQATALGVLAHHWGDEARPTWQVFLTSRSAPLREAAEEVVGVHGGAEDLPEAAARLAKIARTKSSIHMTPPRGAEIVGLLVRHRDDAVARAALDDLSARWDRLGDDLRDWLEEHHRWLDPSHRQDQPVELDSEPEEPLVWPPPAIAREGDRYMLSFEETDMFETRDRFEELAGAHPQIKLIDGDREWISMNIASRDPEALIKELWAAAGSSGQRD